MTFKINANSNLYKKSEMQEDSLDSFITNVLSMIFVNKKTTLQTL